MDIQLHFKAIIRPLLQGRVIPFLGAGVNLYARGAEPWGPGRQLPSGGELTEYLVGNFGYPAGEAADLLRVSQYVTAMLGDQTLYDELHALFDVNYPTTPLHRFLASLPALQREKGYRARHPLIITTNYDDVLERAFDEAGEPYDLVYYVTKGEHSGTFRHRAPGGEARPIETPNKYLGLSFEERSVILKIHGAVARGEGSGQHDSYVITEDDYTDYMTAQDVLSLLPIPLPAALREGLFLFLGYGLRDWNLRVLLRRITKDQKDLGNKSWAVDVRKQEMDEMFWSERKINFINASLEDYVGGLAEQVKALPKLGGGA